MPKSKRDRKVSLTKTEKKVGLEFKQRLVDRIRESVDEYSRIFVFTAENMRNARLKKVREDHKNTTRFFLGKNRVMSLALGRDENEEYASNLHRISKLLRGQCGLLFTNESKQKILDIFGGDCQEDDLDYARTGSKAVETVELKKGEALDQFSFSLEPQLRTQLGMPTTLKRGIIHLVSDFVVCVKGETLNANQARILKLLGYKHAQFKLNMIGCWDKTNEGNEFELLKNWTTQNGDVSGHEQNSEGDDDDDVNMD